MMFRFSEARSLNRMALAVALLLGLTLGKTTTAVATWQHSSVALVAPASSLDGGSVSLLEYQARLSSLDRLLAACRQAMIPANCQSERVGPDLRLALPSGPRSIRFAWARDLLDRAAKEAKEMPKSADAEKPAPSDSPNTNDSDEDTPEPTKPVVQFEEPTLAQQLVDARKRLEAEEVAVAQLAAMPPAQSKSMPSQPNAGGAVSNNSLARQTLTRILAAKEYHAAVAGPKFVDRVLEKVGNWIDRVLGKLAAAGFKSKWIGYSAEIGFVLLLCVGLVWFLIRLEKQGRLGMANIRPAPGADAASTRDWQLWLRDARSAAAQGEWRDAIHLLYWASISRLESSGQWPADRARTPREYLALLSPESAQRLELTRLTRSFESTWYAGRAAEESDFRAAELVASKLGISSGAR